MILKANKKRLYIIAGQSNAVGGGSVSLLSQSVYAMPFSCVTQVEQIGSAGTDPIPWLEYAATGLQPRDALSLGIELSLGRKLADRFGCGEVVIGKFAVNGTSLNTAWNPDGVFPKISNLYRQLVSFIQNTESAQNATMVGFAWIQGNNDANSAAVAGLYSTNLTKLYTQLKADLKHDFKFVYDRLPAGVTGHGYVSIVRAQQEAWAAANSDVTMIDTDDLGLRDADHYTADAFITLGNRFADAFLAADEELRMSSYLVDAILNSVFRGQSLTPSTNVYAALYTSNPTIEDVGTELDIGGYSRQLVSFSPPIRRTARNTAAVSFGSYAANTSAITHVALRDAASGGNLLFAAKFKSPITLPAGRKLIFGVGDISCGIKRGVSEYLAHSLLNTVLLGETFTPPATIYLTLYADDPGPLNGGRELVGGGMSRKLLTFAAPVDHRSHTTVAAQFGPLTATLLPANYLAFRDASTGGNLLISGKMSQTTPMGLGSVLTYAAGELSASLV